MNTAAVSETQSYELLMQAMDAVDQLRAQSHQVDWELDKGQRNRMLREKIKDIYASQGIQVSNTTLDAAIEKLDAQRFRYQPTPPSLSRRLATWYVTRSQWGPKFLGVGAGVGVLAVLVFSFQWGLHAYQAHQLNVARTTAMQSLVQVKKDWSTAQKDLGTLEAIKAPPSVEPAISRLQVLAHKSFLAEQSSARKLHGVHLSTTAQATKVKQVQSLLDDYGSIGEQISGKLAQAKQWMTLAPKVASAEALPQAVPGDFHPGAVTLSGRLEQAVQQANLASAGKVITTVHAYPEAIKRWESLAVPTAFGQHAAARLKAEKNAARKALNAGTLPEATASMDRFRDLKNLVAMPVTMKIVSRAGARSGVWRHPNGHASARTYYLIVDAVGPAKHPVKLPIESVETGKTAWVSTFGLQVPSKVYAQYRDEKKKTGAIANTKIGTKPANQLDLEFSIPTANGYITEW